MLLSRRPSGLAFYVSSTLLTCFAIAILYHLWGFDLRPQPAQPYTSADSPSASHGDTHTDTNSKQDTTVSKPGSRPEDDWESPPDLPNAPPAQPPTPTPTPTLTPTLTVTPTPSPISNSSLSNSPSLSTAPAPTPSTDSTNSTNATGIPKKLWYKLGPNGLNDGTREWTDSCIKNNPAYASEFMTDESADVWVAKAYAARTDIVETYLNLTIPILKADFLRYLLLYDQGGIWSDLDVSCDGTPIDDWIPAEYKDKAAMVVGWEFDVGWGDNIIRQFNSWIIMSKPHTDYMATVIDDILAGLKEKMRENNVATAAGLELKMVGDVVDITGPRRLTTGTLKSLEKALGKKVPISDIANLLEPKLIGDLLIMPGYAFANSSNTYDHAPPGISLASHHYAGSWKNDHGGET